MNSNIASGFAAGAGYLPSSLRVAITTILGALALAFAMWLVAKVMETYGTNEQESADSILSLFCVALIVVLIVAVLGWA